MKKVLFMISMLACGWTTSNAQEGTKLEAEDAVSEKCEVVENDIYSGGKALAMKENNAKITFTYNASEAGKQTVYVGYDGQWGDKTVNISVNGSSSTFQTPVAGVGEAEIGAFIMNEGNNTIEITPSWTWYLIDYIRIVSGSSSAVQFDIAQTPVDAKAADCTKEVYTFLYDNFGKKTISGIMTGDMETANGDVTQHADVKAVYEASGKYPALVGFDFMNATGSSENDSWFKDYTNRSIQLAKDLFNRGGLPAFTWHWRDPSRKSGEFYCKIDGKDACTTRITDAMNADGSWNTSSELYANIIKDIDTVADYFLDMQSAGIACIFRPLHEASGAWFWWGASGAESCVKLYQLIFDEMVNVKGVHNVIWVWNPCNADDADWNPGESYYDVISIDIYNDPFDYGSNYAAFDKLKTLSAGKKLIALSENGPIPDIDKEFEEDAVWSWWMPWYQTWNGKFVDKTSKEEWTKCMSDDRIITLEDRSAGWGTSTAIHSPATIEKSSNAALYDLQGRRVTKPSTKGIYIQNGIKIVVK
jgi:beta-mannanase